MPRQKRQQRAAASGLRLALPALVGAAATLIVGMAAVPTADAKSPGTRYCFHGYCHRVGTLAQTDTVVGWRGYVLASYYDSCHLDRLNPCGLTSSGPPSARVSDNAASPLLPDGTVILAYNPKTGDAWCCGLQTPALTAEIASSTIACRRREARFRQSRRGGTCYQRPAISDERRGELRAPAGISKGSRLRWQVRDLRQRTRVSWGALNVGDHGRGRLARPAWQRRLLRWRMVSSRCRGSQSRHRSPASW